MLDGEEGIIIINNYVIEGVDEVIVNFNDGIKLVVEIIGMDKKIDIVVLKVKFEILLKDVSFGDFEGICVGDWVMVIGNLFGFGGIVMVGIVFVWNCDINFGFYDNFI